MADRAPLQLTIHDCPPDEAARALHVLSAHDLHLEFADIEPDDALHAGTRYVDVEADLGEEDRVATALIEAAPNCAFLVWQDPKYEEDGQVVMYHPALGRVDCGCNAFGDPHVTIEQVRAVAAECAVDRAAVTAAEFLDALSLRLGEPWRVLLASSDHRVIIPDPRSVP